MTTSTDSKLSKVITGGLMLVICSIIFYPMLQIITLAILFSGEGFEEGGRILFVNKENPNILILKQIYQSGAWDGETTTRIVCKNITDDSVENIDTSKIEKAKWIRIKTPIYDSESHETGISLGPERFQEFFKDSNKKGLLKFKLFDQRVFTEVLLPMRECQEIMPDWNNYCDNTFSENFKTYVFLKHNVLVLNTISNDFLNIREFEIMNKDCGRDYEHHLFSIFHSADRLTVARHYKTFQPDEKGMALASTHDEIIVLNDYQISEDGRINKTSPELFGKIIVLR